MALSSIAGITQEGIPQELASFQRSGVVYVLWSGPIAALGQSRLQWKPHNALDYTEVITPLPFAFRRISAIYDPVADRIVAVWDDGQGADGVRSGQLYIARFHPLTGEATSGPTVFGPGSEPKLSYLTTTADQKLLLYFKTAKNVGVYGCRSENGGVTWSSAYPLITGKVNSTSRLKVIPYDGKHVSLAQIGVDARPVREIGMFQRTRPIAQIVFHPTDPTKLFIGEPSKLDNVHVIDNMRGGLVVARDNSELYHLDGVAQGTSDGIASVARLSISGTTLSVDASDSGGGNGDNLVHYSFAPLSGTNVEMPGVTNDAVSLDVTDGFAYCALRHDTSVSGELVVINLTTNAVSSFQGGLQAGDAVGVANFLTNKLAFFATTEAGINRLRVYQENALTPTLLLNIKLPAKATGITVIPRPDNPTQGARLFVSMQDRLNIYDYFTAGIPFQLVDSFVITSTNAGGQVQKARIATNGNIVVPAGRGGVLVLDPSGKQLSQTFLSGKVVQPWKAGTVYALNSLVRPRDTHPFAGSRFYFRATTGGTSGQSEPKWDSVGTVSDSSVVWTPQNVTDGVAVDVALDNAAKRIYVAGIADGNSGTDGRVWILDGTAVLT